MAFNEHGGALGVLVAAVGAVFGLGYVGRNSRSLSEVSPSRASLATQIFDDARDRAERQNSEAKDAWAKYQMAVERERATGQKFRDPVYGYGTNELYKKFRDEETANYLANRFFSFASNEFDKTEANYPPGTPQSLTRHLEDENEELNEQLEKWNEYVNWASTIETPWALQLKR